MAASVFTNRPFFITNMRIVTSKIRLKVTRNEANGANIHCLGFGGDRYQFLTEHLFAGMWWRFLTNESITVYREEDDYSDNQVRIRIWVYE